MELFPINALAGLDEHTLFMQLQRAVSLVLATKEAMWEELLDKVDNNREFLEAYGFDEDDFERMEMIRAKFEAMVEQYKKLVSLHLVTFQQMLTLPLVICRYGYLCGTRLP